MDYEVSLYWKDEPDEFISGYIITDNTERSLDEDVFFHIENEVQLDELMKEDNGEDFIITSWERI